jgi:hypothetical protein
MPENKHQTIQQKIDEGKTVFRGVHRPFFYQNGREEDWEVNPPMSLCFFSVFGLIGNPNLGHVFHGFLIWVIL